MNITLQTIISSVFPGMISPMFHYVQKSPLMYDNEWIYF